MKNIIRYIYVLAMTASLFGCTDEPIGWWGDNGDYKVSLEDHELYVDCYYGIQFRANANDEYDPQSYDINIYTYNTTTKWKISDVPDWLNLSKTSGSMSETVTVTAKNNLQLVGRSAVLKVTSPDMPGSYEINVSQEAGDPMVQVSSNDLNFVGSGGTQTVKIEYANCEWYVECDESWVTCEKKSDTELSIIVKPNYDDYWREARVYLKCEREGYGGWTVCEIRVTQDELQTVIEATCAEVIDGPDSKTYRVKGICTGIANTTYGNWYLTDETGQIYIYGTLGAKGQQKNFSSLGIEVGDEITVEGPKHTYVNNAELVNVTVLNINKKRK